MVYTSRLKEASGYHFSVFNDAEGSVFYVLVYLDGRKGRRQAWHGPFPGDAFTVLKLEKTRPSGAGTR